MILVKKLSDNAKGYIDNYFQIVEEMAERMRAVQQTQSVSEMFINQMIAHHEGAISMSENILNYTTNTDIENLAKAIIIGENQQIIQMEDMLSTCSACENNSRDVSLYQRQFNTALDMMLRRMNSVQAGNNLDVAYLNGMIPHTEGVISMARNVLQFDICSALRELVEKLIQDKTSQLEQMRLLLRRLA